MAEMRDIAAVRNLNAKVRYFAAKPDKQIRRKFLQPTNRWEIHHTEILAQPFTVALHQIRKLILINLKIARAGKSFYFKTLFISAGS